MKLSTERLIARYRSRGVLIDANLLLLFFVGMVDRQLISSFERTRNFAPEDYDTLCRLLVAFRKRVVTPNVLTEVSNLAGKLKDKYCQAVFEGIRQAFESLHEEYVPSRVATKRNEFVKFGLTDAVLMALAEKKMLLLTADFPLANFCASTGADVLNFNHLRMLNWQ